MPSCKVPALCGIVRNVDGDVDIWWFSVLCNTVVKNGRLATECAATTIQRQMWWHWLWLMWDAVKVIENVLLDWAVDTTDLWIENVLAHSWWCPAWINACRYQTMGNLPFLVLTVHAMVCFNKFSFIFNLHKKLHNIFVFCVCWVINLCRKKNCKSIIDQSQFLEWPK